MTGMPGGCRMTITLPVPTLDITRPCDPAQPGQPVPDTIHLPPQPRSFSGRHYPPNPENEQACSFSGFWPLSICCHYPPNSETEHSHSFSGFVAVSAIPNTKNAAFLAAFFVFGLFYSPFISPLLRHNKHNHFGRVFCVWVLLLHSKHDKCGSFGRIFMFGLCFPPLPSWLNWPHFSQLPPD